MSDLGSAIAQIWSPLTIPAKATIAIVLVLGLILVPLLTISRLINEIEVNAASNNKKIDFNGDGFEDLAIGVPFESVGNVSSAGAVNVIYGSATGLSATSVSDQIWDQGSSGIEDFPEANDGFGSSIAAGDFNGDEFSDLAVGVPDEDVASFANVGAVNVIYGSSQGLTATEAPDGSGRTDQFWTQDSPNVEDGIFANEHFGSSLATGDFNRDGYSDLAVGVPRERIGSTDNAGAVNVIYGSASGLSATSIPDQLWSQGSLEIEDFPEGDPELFGAGDFFGGSIAKDLAELNTFGTSLATHDFNRDGYDDLAIGVSSENVSSGSNQDAGAVNVIYGSSSGLRATAAPDGSGRTDQFWSQDSPNVEDVAETAELDGEGLGDYFGWSLAAGDFNRDGYDDLAIGAPIESTFSETENTGKFFVGAVNVIYGSSSGLSATFVQDQFWHQDVADVEDDGAGREQFGASLAAGDFNKDGYDDLAIGAPAFGGAGTGEVNVIYGSWSGLSATAVPDQLWSQDSTDIKGAAEFSEQFGSSLAAGDFNNDGYSELAVGVQLESVGSFSGAGAVNVIYGSSEGLHATSAGDGSGRTNQLWSQDSPNVEDGVSPGDQFGSALA